MLVLGVSVIPTLGKLKLEDEGLEVSFEYTASSRAASGNCRGVPNTCMLFRCWPPGRAREQDSLQHLSLFSQTLSWEGGGWVRGQLGEMQLAQKQSVCSLKLSHSPFRSQRLPRYLLPGS